MYYSYIYDIIETIYDYTSVCILFVNIYIYIYKYIEREKYGDMLYKYSYSKYVYGVISFTPACDGRDIHGSHGGDREFEYAIPQNCLVLEF